MPSRHAAYTVYQLYFTPACPEYRYSLYHLVAHRHSPQAKVVIYFRLNPGTYFTEITRTFMAYGLTIHLHGVDFAVVDQFASM